MEESISSHSESITSNKIYLGNMHNLIDHPTITPTPLTCHHSTLNITKNSSFDVHALKFTFLILVLRIETKTLPLLLPNDRAFAPYLASGHDLVRGKKISLSLLTKCKVFLLSRLVCWPSMTVGHKSFTPSVLSWYCLR